MSDSKFDVFLCAVWESNPRAAALLVHVVARPQNPRLNDAAAAADDRRGDRQTDGSRHGPGHRPLQVLREEKGKRAFFF